VGKRLAVAVLVLCLCVLFTTNIYAAGTYNMLTDEQARKHLLKNNTNLLRLSQNQELLKLNYEESKRQADTAARFIDDYSKWLSDYILLPLRKQRDIVPEYARLQVDLGVLNSEVAKNSLQVSLREIYGALYTASKHIEIKRKAAESYGRKYFADKNKFEKGLIIPYELEISELNYFKSLNELAISRKDYKILERNLNLLIGMPIETSYDEIKLSEKVCAFPSQTCGKYIESALEQRLEIVSLKREKEIKEREKGLYEERKIQERYDEAQDEYQSIIREIDLLDLKIRKAEVGIEKEITEAYIDIEKEYLNLKTSEENLDAARGRLNQLKIQQAQGYITGTIVEEFENNVRQLEYLHKAAIFNYNTKLVKLENAAGVGPAYLKGEV
jgi:outer membrane protein TolC